MRYATPGALRAALGQRLVQQANKTGTDIARLRRWVVFERLLVRFAYAGATRWVLKGGTAVEIRFTDRARATRDLDLALDDPDADQEAVRDALIEALQSAPQTDFFEFRLAKFQTMSIDRALGRVWRASVDCHLDGRTFERVVLDLVTCHEELARVEQIRLPGTLEFAGLPTADVVAVDLNQHFAEKLHAMIREYGDRPSSRVKDLADLMLFLDIGLPAGPELYDAVIEVFATRGTPLPTEVPNPPHNWEARYAELATELDLSAGTLPKAMSNLRAFWTQARARRHT